MSGESATALLRKRDEAQQRIRRISGDSSKEQELQEATRTLKSIERQLRELKNELTARARQFTSGIENCKRVVTAADSLKERNYAKRIQTGKEVAVKLLLEDLSLLRKAGF